VASVLQIILASLSPSSKSRVSEIIKKHFRITDPLVAEEGCRDFLHAVQLKPYASVDGLRNARRLMKLLNPKVGELKVEDFIDGRLVRKLDQSGFIDRLYKSYRGR
jgi:hypothetical protein